ncbi:hypothetical protein [Helicobacter mesocricetorum]|uniref:hypothetical protein n=1 Tax=Helicobacter mesocricetorum TaxID=87012 RepID=UPI000CF1769B|nr:hypothetical protein [Helicobacter mesocricetorum]
MIFETFINFLQLVGFTNNILSFVYGIIIGGCVSAWYFKSREKPMQNHFSCLTKNDFESYVGIHFLNTKGKKSVFIVKHFKTKLA